MDKHKRKWLERRGYKPLTDTVIHEILSKEEHAKFMDYEKMKGTFQYYRRYGDLIMPYSEGYLEKAPLSMLKRCHRKNVRDFIIFKTRIGRYLEKVYKIFKYRILM